VQKPTGSLIELQRGGEVLEIEQPTDPRAKLLFARLRVGQIVHEPMVVILIDKADKN
jgi:hypothetical protein